MGVTMFSFLLCSLAISTVLGQTNPPYTTEDGIACQECVNEMHRFGQLIHDGREAMAGYLAENYCPTLGEHAQDCPENLAGHYPDMVNAVVDRFIAGEQGALHMCQSMGACRPVPKIFTCDECIEGMEWIEVYMKEFFGNEYSMDQYEMMEKFFRNKNDMDSFEMMMKFNEKEKNMDMFEMMRVMEKMYGNDYKGNKFNSNDFDMMKNFDDKDYKMPVQPRFRFKRQASGNTRPTDLTKPAQDLNRGDRLYAKLEEQKKYMESYVGNLTCVLREVNVLNKENEIDVPALKKSLQQYTMPSPWFKKRYEELIDVCYETAVNLPAAIVEEYKVKGEFGEVNLAHVKQFTKCCTEGKQRLCMNQDTKNKIESNFGPIKAILDEIKLTEYQLFPLVLQMLQGEESEYLGETYYG